MFLLKVKEILADYDPNFMAMSLDEAYLNITKHLQERQNWPEDKRKYFIKTGNSLENGKQFIRTNWKNKQKSLWINPVDLLAYTDGKTSYTFIMKNYFLKWKIRNLKYTSGFSELNVWKVTFKPNEIMKSLDFKNVQSPWKKVISLQFFS